MMELAVMAQSVNVMQEAIAEVDDQVNGPARDEVHHSSTYNYSAVWIKVWWELNLVAW